MRALARISILALFAGGCGGAGSTSPHPDGGAGTGATGAGGSGGGSGGKSGAGGSSPTGGAGTGAAGATAGSGGGAAGGGASGGGGKDGGGSGGTGTGTGGRDGGSSDGGGGASGGGGDASGVGGANGDGGVGRSYTTKFPLAESPISENATWINGQTTGLDWHDVSTTPGLAIGHQSGSSYTDGTALLTGSWGPTQTVQAVVHTVKPMDPCYQEVELRLRSALKAHSCTGYEISFKATKTAGAYLIIVRWNGPLGDFTYLKRSDGAQYGVADGDTVKATIVGNVITAYLNGVPVGTATDSTYAMGNPGMGFNLETAAASCLGTNGDYGFTSFSATAN
jgi:hypothetical protein